MTTRAPALTEIPLGKITPSSTNRKLTDADCVDLVASIQAMGVLEPILVRKDGMLDGFVLIAGERRWRAAKQAGLKAIPAIVRDDVDDQVAEEMQLVENLQRQDLDPLYEAEGYQRLLARDGWSQQILSQRVGVSQSHVSKRLALLQLPDKVRKLIGADANSGGITISDAVELAKLKDHPDRIQQLLDDRCDQDEIVWLVASELRHIEDDQKAAVERERLVKAGVIVLTDAEATAQKAQRVDAYSGLNVDPKKHEKEPCRAVVVDHQFGDLDLREYCIEPERHTEKGESKLKGAPKPGGNGASRTRRATPAKATKSPAAIKKEQEARHAADLRWAFLIDVVQRATKSQREQLLDQALSLAVEQGTWDHDDRMGYLLGLDTATKKTVGGPNWAAAVKEYAAKSKANLQRAALAAVVADGQSFAEDTLVRSPGPHGEAFLRMLVKLGYKPHPAEQADFDRAAKATK